VLLITDKEGREDLVGLLAEYQVDLHVPESGTILHRHSRKGNIDMVKLLLNFDADIEAKDQVSLQRETLTRPLAKLCMHVRVGCIAREDAHVSVCCSMLVPVRVRRAGCPALEGVTACRGRSCRCVAAADCTPALLDGETSLHKASGKWHLEVVQALLKAGANI
jgi:hypothetical protein